MRVGQSPSTSRLALIAAVAAVLVSTPARGQNDSGASEIVAITDATIIASADAAPIPDGTLLIRDGRVTALGPRRTVAVPPGATVIDAHGGTIVPGFWNSHVHLSGPEWVGSDTAAATHLDSALSAMLTRWGVVHVFDVGSYSVTTRGVQRRIAAGDVAGPDILSTYEPFVPENGTPRYVLPLVLPELRDSVVAMDSARARLAAGADGIKLFTVPLTVRRPYPVMLPGAVRAVTRQAHAQSKLVFAHPTNLAGVEDAVYNGVDVLAHTAPMAGVLPDSLLRTMLQRHVALIPTLALWEYDYGRDTSGMGAFVRAGEQQLREYAARGGRILFGTDVGYTRLTDPTREYELMRQAGLTVNAILRSMTSAPAAEYGWSGRTGQLEPGMYADLVILGGDPRRDFHALTDVRYTMRRGHIIYRR